MPLGQYNEPPRVDADKADSVAGGLAGEKARGQMQLQNILPTETMGKGDIADMPELRAGDEEAAEENGAGDEGDQQTEVMQAQQQAREKEAQPIRVRLQTITKQMSPLEKVVRNLERTRGLLRAKEYTIDQWLDTFKLLGQLWAWAGAGAATLVGALLTIPAAILATLFILTFTLTGIMIIFYQRLPLSTCAITKKKIDSITGQIEMQKKLLAPLEQTKRRLYRELNQLVASSQ